MDISENEKLKKWLIAFDMDHTILDGNSDYLIRDLLKPNKKIEINSYCRLNKLSWMSEMQMVFDELHYSKISINEIKDKIISIPFTKGMIELFDFLRKLKLENESYNYNKNQILDNKSIKIQIIILSGANMMFIKWVIEKMNIQDLIDNYYSFSCLEYNNKLILGKFHEYKCNTCDPFLCKKKAIEDFHIKDNNYEKVIYLGDGLNDYCACLALNRVKNSIIYYRDNYNLDYFLHKDQNAIENKSKLKSKLFKWSNGFDILNNLKNEIFIN